MDQNLHSIEVAAFLALTTIIGLLALLRMTIIELIEMTQTMLEYVLQFHHHVKRFKARLNLERIARNQGKVN